MRAAGFEPRARIPVQGAPPPRRRRRRYLYLHRCPICQEERIARRVVRYCSACAEEGLDVAFEIWRRPERRGWLW
jgi:hypothetical protein